MKFFYIYIKRTFINKYLQKTVWVFNNFLRMECYRKLCNNLYWKKLKPGTLPYSTRCWLIIVTALSMIWLAFFFDPLDPDYSKSVSRLILLFSNIYKRIETSIEYLTHGQEKIFRQNYYLKTRLSLGLGGTYLWNTHKTYLKTSAILI